MMNWICNTWVEDTSVSGYECKDVRHSHQSCKSSRYQILRERETHVTFIPTYTHPIGWGEKESSKRCRVAAPKSLHILTHLSLTLSFSLRIHQKTRIFFFQKGFEQQSSSGQIPSLQSKKYVSLNFISHNCLSVVFSFWEFNSQYLCTFKLQSFSIKGFHMIKFQFH